MELAAMELAAMELAAMELGAILRSGKAPPLWTGTWPLISDWRVGNVRGLASKRLLFNQISWGSGVEAVFLERRQIPQSSWSDD